MKFFLWVISYGARVENVNCLLVIGDKNTRKKHTWLMIMMNLLCKRDRGGFDGGFERKVDGKYLPS